MLTHSEKEAAAYDNDPLITKNISARVLLDLADTARRVVEDAAAIDVPVLMLVADKDFVVKQAVQRTFFERLSSPLKRYVLLKDCYHAVFYENDTREAIEASRQFINDCFIREAIPLQHYHAADREGHSAIRYEALQKGKTGSLIGNVFYEVQRLMLRYLGRLSDGMKIGLTHGFDSGASLDYVYRNQAGGRLLIGKFMDRGYLDAIGWRGIRLRKFQLQQSLADLIAQHSGSGPLRILDIAAGSGRYILETVKRFQDKNIQVTLRDFVKHNLDQAKELAQSLQLSAQIDYQLRDAFNTESYPDDEEAYDIVVVSGLYELFSENEMVLRSLRGIERQLKEGGHIIYTGQPWHPQLDMIARTLTNHRGASWLMRLRSQAEIDALVESICCKKIDSKIGLAGIFTVSVARKTGAPVSVD
jgi:ubiquinone/menaquinone biosynthesis C-methylase UbiE